MILLQALLWLGPVVLIAAVIQQARSSARAGTPSPPEAPAAHASMPASPTPPGETPAHASAPPPSPSAPPPPRPAAPPPRAAAPVEDEDEEVTNFTLAVTGTRPFLRTISGPGPKGNLFVSATGVTSIGRAKDNDIVIPGDSASSRHCRIEQTGNTYTLVDLGSTNKTWVNGVEKDRVVLRNGDKITVGDISLIFALFGDRT